MRTTITSTAAATLGRLGGAAGTDKQNAARKVNAQKAGRPGRACNVCGEPVLGGHVARVLDETCGAHGWHWKQRNEPATTAPVLTTTELHAVLNLMTATRLASVVPASGALVRAEKKVRALIQTGRSL